MRARALAAVAALWLSALPASALADIKAFYVNADGSKPMTVEVADSGTLRSDLPEKNAYALSIDGQDYIVTTDGPKPVVMRLQDVTTVLKEEIKRLPPPFRELFKQMFSEMKLVQKGEATINGRTGTAYFTKGDSSSKPTLVMSNDPALALLGKAMVRQFDMSFGLMGEVFGGSGTMFKDMRDALATGTPLTFDESDLKTVETVTIDPKRLVLPGEPATLDGVRAEMKRSGIMKMGK